MLGEEVFHDFWLASLNCKNQMCSQDRNLPVIERQMSALQILLTARHGCVPTHLKFPDQWLKAARQSAVYSCTQELKHFHELSCLVLSQELVKHQLTKLISLESTSAVCAYISVKGSETAGEASEQKVLFDQRIDVGYSVHMLSCVGR